MKCLDPIAFTLFGISIRWYGVLISLGMILAMVVVIKRANSYGIDPNKVLDIIIIAIPAGVIGARLYYVLFNWDFYQGDLYKIINIRGGGLAIHRGLIVGILAAVLLCLLWRIRILPALDLGMPGVAIAQAVGRWGNYFNKEAYGTPTDLPWAIIIEGQRVHPTFLYESLWNLGLFLFLIWFEKRKKYDGQVFLLYVMLYSIARFFIEGLRIDSLMFGPIRVAQGISAVAFVISLIILLLNKKSHRNMIFRRH